MRNREGNVDNEGQRGQKHGGMSTVGSIPAPTPPLRPTPPATPPACPPDARPNGGGGGARDYRRLQRYTRPCTCCCCCCCCCCCFLGGLPEPIYYSAVNKKICRTLCFTVICSESSTRMSSSKFRPHEAGYLEWAPNRSQHRIASPNQHPIPSLGTK